MQTLTQERLKEVLHYDPDTGIFTWKVSTGKRVKVGYVAGCNSRAGYIDIGVDGKLYRAHRLAFFYMTGEWPKDQVDHIDTNRSNNRWANLREATHQHNMANRSTYGAVNFKGVSMTSRGKYRAQISTNKSRKPKHLGTFSTPEEAHAAYVKAANDNFGEFARTA